MKGFVKASRVILAVILAAELVFIQPALKTSAATAASGAIAKGIDVAKYQGTINWAQVKASGISFAFIKAGSTKSGMDPMYMYNMTQAAANGIKTGVYIYSYATNVEQATMEAMLCLQWMEPFTVSMPVVLDIEDKIHKGLSPVEINAIINTFCSIIDSAGYYPMVYTYKNFYTGKVGATPWEKWFAQYGSQLDISGAAFWQYTSSGSVPGIAGRVDMNYQYKDLSKVIIQDGFKEHNGSTRLYLNYKMQKGWASYQGKKYLLDAYGNMVKGLFTDADGKIYYLNPADGGASAVGLTEINKQDFYFDANGAMSFGFIDYGAGMKYFDPALGGAMVKNGLFAQGNSLYYALKDGTIATGLQDINGNTFFFDATGIMQTGFIDIGAGMRYFDAATGGAMVKNGFFAQGNSLYYALKDGTIATGLQTINGYNYFFNEAGALVVNQMIDLNGVPFMATETGVLVEIPVEVPADPAADVQGTVGAAVAQ